MIKLGFKIRFVCENQIPWFSDLMCYEVYVDINNNAIKVVGYVGTWTYLEISF
jgi:hypothetical protein